VLAGLVPTSGGCDAASATSLTVLERRARAADDELVLLPNSASRLELTANDLGWEHAGREELSTAITRGASGGRIEVLGNGAVLYTPEPGFVGSDSLAYTLCVDGHCSTADVTISVTAGSVVASEPTTDPSGVVVTALAPAGSAGTPGYVTPDRVVAKQERCGRSPLAWGGFRNRAIPTQMLFPIGGGHVLQERAHAAFLQLREAASADGVTIAVTDSYRSYAAQVDVRRRKGHLVATAVPGTSVHGWGKALDLGVRDPVVRSWLERHAADHGWVNPGWAKRSGASFEPWHYEFTGGTSYAGPGTCSADHSSPVVTVAAAPQPPVPTVVRAVPGPGGVAPEAPAAPPEPPSGELLPAVAPEAPPPQVGSVGWDYRSAWSGIDGSTGLPSAARPGLGFGGWPDGLLSPPSVSRSYHALPLDGPSRTSRILAALGALAGVAAVLVLAVDARRTPRRFPSRGRFRPRPRISGLWP
jgi:hypothetical protein